ncbi:DMT family transporter [Tianweitania sp. BSSL-BM11]|uniref:DMT family transporter n=1 Tax=Tianweitania aestuarii TaxID=2814886 RepID=A0ABS5RVF0_9HYPH|nr:DMT family transporter [Tianweitania aestuarii]MBS9721035.1 DMT family transporter [Tianweitania aestuarii]
MTRVQANLLLLLAGAIWGMGFVAQATAMDTIGPLLFVGLRFLVATLCVLPFVLRESSKAALPLKRTQWLAFVWVGLMLFGAITAQQFGLLTTSVTNSGFLTGLYVVLTPILGVVLFRQFPHVVVWPAALCALTGIFLLSGGTLTGLSTGDWLTIIGAAFCSLQVIFIARSAAQTGRPITLAATQFAVCGIIGTSAALVFEPISVQAINGAAKEILYAGIFSGGLAFTLQVVGQRYTTASQAAIFLSSEAVFAALFGAIFLHERLPSAALGGCALILASMLVVEIVPAVWRRKAARLTP